MLTLNGQWAIHSTEIVFNWAEILNFIRFYSCFRFKSNCSDLGGAILVGQ